jgi:hypothetical protein
VADRKNRRVEFFLNDHNNFFVNAWTRACSRSWHPSLPAVIPPSMTNATLVFCPTVSSPTFSTSDRIVSFIIMALSLHVRSTKSARLNGFG